MYHQLTSLSLGLVGCWRLSEYAPIIFLLRLRYSVDTEGRLMMAEICDFVLHRLFRSNLRALSHFIPPIQVCLGLFTFVAVVVARKGTFTHAIAAFVRAFFFLTSIGIIVIAGTYSEKKLFFFS
jgi:hypothetical protein